MERKLYWICNDFTRIDFFTSLMHEEFSNLEDVDKNQIILKSDPDKLSEFEVNKNYLIVIGDTKLNKFRPKIIKLCKLAYKTILIADSYLSGGVVNVCGGTNVNLLMHNFSERNDDRFNQEVKDCVKTMNDGKVYFSKLALTVLYSCNSVLRSAFNNLNEDEFLFAMCIGVGMNQREYATLTDQDEGRVSKIKNNVLKKLTFINGKHPTYEELLNYTKRIIEDFYAIKLT